MANAPSIATPNRRPLAHGEAPSLSRVTTTTKRLPSRILIHAVQKWGKTSFAAQAPSPIFLCTRGEDGLMTLLDNGLVQPTPHFPECLPTWGDVKLALNELIVREHQHKTVVIDTINGAIQLAQEHVIANQYDGSYEKFDAYGRGGQRLLPAVIELTTLLDRLRERGMAVILPAHSVVKTFKNPEGVDYPRWEPPIFKEVQEHLDRWCDAILFGKYEVHAESPDKKATKGKAYGGQDRILCTEYHPTYAAGNRFGLPAEIECGDSPETAWSNFVAALKGQKGS
jgi:hypothetical protein